jgi:DNA replication protein DnaC
VYARVYGSLRATHLAIALGIRACLAGHRVAFRTATEWVALLADAQRHGRLDT